MHNIDLVIFLESGLLVTVIWFSSDEGLDALLAQELKHVVAVENSMHKDR